MSQRMSQWSRRSFVRADYATVVETDVGWMILLSTQSRSIWPLEQDETWTVCGGDDVAVAYRSSYAAVQAIQRVRPDLPWKVIESSGHKRKDVTPSKPPEASVDLQDADPAPAEPSAKAETFDAWIRNSTLGAQVAGILNQLPDDPEALKAFVEHANALKSELKKHGS